MKVPGSHQQSAFREAKPSAKFFNKKKEEARSAQQVDTHRHMDKRSPSNLAPDPLFLNPNYHELIGLVYDAVNNSRGFFPFLERFIQVFEAHSASFSIYDLQASTMVGFWTVNMPQHALEFYAEHISHQDALLATAMSAYRAGDQRFIASNLDLGENAAAIRRETRTDEWLQSYGAQEAAGAITLLDENYVNFFAIQRSPDQPPFSRHELQLFDLFLPHLNRAVHLYTQLSARNLVIGPEQQALNQIQQGILLCDATYRMVFKNATAGQIIANNPDLQLGDDGLLSFRNKSFAREFAVQLSLAIEQSMAQQGCNDTVLCYRHRDQNLTLVISPLAAANTGNADAHRGGAMISLYDWSRRRKVEPDSLRHFFGLTPTEAQVAALLVEGQSVADIAEQVRRSRETIKSHLKAIFRKTNTSRQGELIALLSTSALS